ncbi:hypothetical protein KI387_015394, partial [Taxus chinensis]
GDMKTKWMGQKLTQPFAYEYDVEDSDVLYMDLNDLKTRMTSKDRRRIEDQIFTSGLFTAAGHPVS